MKFVLILILFFELIFSQNETNNDSSDYSFDENSLDFSYFENLLNDLIKQLEKPLEPEEEEISTNTTIRDLLHLQSLFSRSFDAFYKTFFPLLLNSNIEISANCLSTLMAMIEGIRQQKEWPLKFLDSSARLPFSGLFDGTVSDYGEYDECLAIKHKDSSREVYGKYCLTQISLRLPKKPKKLLFFEKILNFSKTSLENTFWERIERNANLFYIANGLRFGICSPDSCSNQDLEYLAQKFLEPILRLKVFIPKKCETIYTTIEWTLHQMISIIILIFLMIFVLISTLVHSFQLSSSRIFKCFSIIENTKKLFSRNTKTKRLKAIHGMRVISIVWILIGHVYLMQFFQIFHVLRRILFQIPKLSWFRYQPLKLGAFLQVDTFLMIGGVTASYVLLDVLPSVDQFDYFAFLLLRWLRYSPALIGCILIYFLLPQLGSGPIFAENISLMSSTCESYWWRNLLYINNFYDVTGNCATHTWYLAVDFQLYALSPLVIFALKKNTKLGTLLCLAIILLGSLLTLLAPILKSETLLPSMYSLSTLLSQQNINFHFRLLYWSTLQHISPYFIGILLGFFIWKYDKINFQNKYLEFGIWIICLTSGIGTIFWTTNWMDSSALEESPSYWWRILFTLVHKISWTILPAWIILTSAFDRPGPIGRFLSWDGWIVVSRLTYGIYLIQLVPIVLRVYSTKYTLPFDDFYNLSVSALTLVLVICLSFILFVLFESPCSQAMKVKI